MPLANWFKRQPTSRPSSPRLPHNPADQPSQAPANFNLVVGGAEVIEPGKAKVVADVIFVHGLRGDKIVTWSKDGVFWPRHILSEDMKQIRIITWGYDSSVVRVFAGSSQASIFGHAENLLADIASQRLRPGTVESRPIIFIGHSLGGIVIKQVSSSLA